MVVLCLALNFLRLLSYTLIPPKHISSDNNYLNWAKVLMAAHTHCTGSGQGPGNDGFLHYAMYCTHYRGKGTGTWSHCFLLCPSRSLSWSRAVCLSHYRCFLNSNRQVSFISDPKSRPFNVQHYLCWCNKILLKST